MSLALVFILMFLLTLNFCDCGLNRDLSWTGWPCVPHGCSAVALFGSDLHSSAAAKPKCFATTIHRRPEDEPAGVSADAVEHPVSPAAV